MADIKTPEERSRNMARIRNTDTKPEEYIRKLLFSRGYRYRKNVSNIPGHPDIWLPKYDTAIFVHGCFWHRHKACKYAYIPKSHEEFWETKFQKNIERDRVVEKQLVSAGIRHMIIWGCTVNKMMKSDKEKDLVMQRIDSFLFGSESFLEI